MMSLRLSVLLLLTLACLARLGSAPRQPGRAEEGPDRSGGAEGGETSDGGASGGG